MLGDSSQGGCPFARCYTVVRCAGTSHITRQQHGTSVQEWKADEHVMSRNGGGRAAADG